MGSCPLHPWPSSCAHCLAFCRPHREGPRWCSDRVRSSLSQSVITALLYPTGERAGQHPCRAAGPPEGRRWKQRIKAAGRESRGTRLHVCWLQSFPGPQGGLQKVGCSSAGEPQGGPDLTSSCPGGGKLVQSPWCRWVATARVPIVMYSAITTQQWTSGDFPYVCVCLKLEVLFL